jgi:hypothetical protein
VVAVEMSAAALVCLPSGHSVRPQWMARTSVQNHQRAAEVNPDASLSFAVRGMHARARHVYGDLDGSIGSVGPLRAARCTAPSERNLAHSRRCRDRSRSRSAPELDSERREKIAHVHVLVWLRHTDVDEKHHE